MALFGDVAKQALSKAEEVYRLIVTVQVQIENLVQKVKDSDHHLTERHRDLVQRQHNFEMAVNAKLAEFEARLRAVEKDQDKLHGKVTENYAKVIAALAEQHLGRKPTQGEVFAKLGDGPTTTG